MCKYFLKGSCKFGNKCALIHTMPSGNSIKMTAGSPANSLPKHAMSSNQSKYHQQYAYQGSEYSDDQGDCVLPKPQPLPSPESIKNPSVPLPIRQRSMPDIFRWSADDRRQTPSSGFLFYSSSLENSQKGPYAKALATQTPGESECQSPHRDSFENETLLPLELSRLLSQEDNHARMPPIDTSLSDLQSASLPCGSSSGLLSLYHSSGTSKHRHHRRRTQNSVKNHGPGKVTPDPFSPFPDDYSEGDDTQFFMETDERMVQTESVKKYRGPSYSAVTRQKILEPSSSLGKVPETPKVGCIMCSCIICDSTFG
jgi:hypothetical protein